MIPEWIRVTTELIETGIVILREEIATMDQGSTLQDLDMTTGIDVVSIQLMATETILLIEVAGGTERVITGDTITMAHTCMNLTTDRPQLTKILYLLLKFLTVALTLVVSQCQETLGIFRLEGVHQGIQELYGEKRIDTVLIQRRSTIPAQQSTQLLMPPLSIGAQAS